MTSEEKSALISGKFAVATALISAIVGFLGGKSDYIDLSKHHSEELHRQRAIIEEKFSQRELEHQISSWHQKSKLLQGVRNNVIRENKLNVRDWESVNSHFNQVVALDDLFDDITYFRFLSDHASEYRKSVFTSIINERSRAIEVLQKIIFREFSKQSATKNDTDRANALIDAFNNEAISFANYVGFIMSSTIINLQATERTIQSSAPVKKQRRKDD